MSAVQTDRLNRLADLLEADAKNKKGVKFDLETWANRKQKKTNKTMPVECGTTACAVGLACISGEFASDGLGYQVMERYIPGVTYIEPVYHGRIGFDAVMAFFGISQVDAHKLFCSDWYAEDGPVKGAKAERRVGKPY